MTTLREAAQRALEALEWSWGGEPLGTKERDAIIALKAALAEQPGSIPQHERLKQMETQRLAKPTGKEALQVPSEIAAELTTTDLAWLETRRLTRLWKELGQMRWVGVDEGWNLAVEAMRSRLNDECQAVLDWKAKADQSQATAIELLQKLQKAKDE